MFTIKFYSNYESGTWGRQRIFAAESFTVLKSPNGAAEITLHQKNANDDFRIDIEWEGFRGGTDGGPPVFQKAVIENAAGRTTEIITLGPDHRKGQASGNRETWPKEVSDRPTAA